MQLSANFSLAQLSASETALARGITNIPPPEIVENLKLLAAGLEQAQEVLGYPLTISSAYRSPELNLAVGGAEKSQHCTGLAADFTCPEFGTPLDIAAALRDAGLRFDQCILEFGRWVHLSFSAEPRVRLLTIHDSKEGYLVGLWDTEGNKVG
jgi:hypothetical protein